MNMCTQFKVDILAGASVNPRLTGGGGPFDAPPPEYSR